MLLLAAAVLCLQAGLGYPSAILLAGAAVCFYLFYRNERQHLSPIVHGSLFDNSIFRKCCAMSALNYFTMYGVLFQVPILLIVLGQTDPLRAGTMLLAMTAAMMFSGFSSGFLIASLGTRATLIVAQTAGLAGSFSLMFLMPHYGEAAVMPSIALLGVSAGLVMPSVRATAVGCVSASLAGTASGSEGTARYIGGALGIACMSAVLATGDDLATHISVLYLYAAAVSLTLIIALTLPRHIELIGNDETD
jgi:sugar phosphate permease